MAEIATMNEPATFTRYKPLLDECSLSLCAKTIYTSVVGGRLSETVQSKFELEEVRQACYRADALPEDEFQVLSVPADQAAFQPQWNRTFAVSANDKLATAVNMANVFTTNDISAVGRTLESWSRTDYPRALEKIATGMTNQLRQLANNTPVEGVSSKLEPYMEVQWAWITYLVTVMTMGLVLLAATVVSNARRGLQLWRDSVPALLFSEFHGIDKVGLQLRNPRQVEEAANSTRGHLDNLTSRGLGFVAA